MKFRSKPELSPLGPNRTSILIIAIRATSLLLVGTLIACSDGSGASDDGGESTQAMPGSSGDGASLDLGGDGDSDGNANGEADLSYNGDGDGDGDIASPPSDKDAPSGSNVALGGSQDIGFFRALLEAGTVPTAADFDASGFFAEHHTEAPKPSCGERVCLEPMIGVMGNLMNGNNCSMIQLALTSPIAADLENRPPLDLSVVVDVSGSMQEAGKIEFVRDGLNLLIDGLKDEDRMALITYSSLANVDLSMTEVVGNRGDMREKVNALVAAGGTNLYDGLELGYSELLKGYDSSRQSRVILLSDGTPTEGNTNTADIIRMSRGFNSDGVGLTTVGLGTNFSVDLMRDLALQADGNFYFLEDSGAVDEVFTEELSYFTVPIAFDLKLKAEAGEHYVFGNSYGSPFWENTRGGGSLDVPSVFIAHRDSASDITDEGGRRGGGSALLLEFMPTLFEDDGSGIDSAIIATVEVEFREPGTNEIIKDRVQIEYPFAPYHLEKGGYFDAPSTDSIQKSFIMLNIFIGLRDAVTAFHEDGDATGAIEGLLRMETALIDYNVVVEDDDLDYDIALIRQLIDLMLDEGIEEPVDVVYPDDIWEDAE